MLHSCLKQWSFPAWGTSVPKLQDSRNWVGCAIFCLSIVCSDCRKILWAGIFRNSGGDFHLFARHNDLFVRNKGSESFLLKRVEVLQFFCLKWCKRSTRQAVIGHRLDVSWFWHGIHPKTWFETAQRRESFDTGRSLYTSGIYEFHCEVTHWRKREPSFNELYWINWVQSRCTSRQCWRCST